MAAPNFFDVFQPHNLFPSIFYTTANAGSMLPVYQPIVLGNDANGYVIRYVLLTQLPVIGALPVHRENALLFYSFVNPPLPPFPPEFVVSGWQGSVRVKLFLHVYSPIVVGNGIGIHFLGYKLTNVVRSRRYMPAASPPPQPPAASLPPQPPAASLPPSPAALPNGC